ncbi:hypothetical protein MACK_003689 [Theileria orientalis]|uniref:Uncharacterized protein n=1 Tax=Theileria orientalis TaxID=68886 RepID=A0A976SJL9_THEOR|nr:hypothetical protein MACK_003689 [Theileria orientalis]
MTTTRKVLFTVLLLFLALLITAGLLLFFLKPWAKKKIDTPLGIPVDEHPNFIQVFTLFENQPMINDTTKYTVNKRSHLSSEIYEYCLNEDALCTQVKFEDGVFWKHSEDSAYGYPKSFTLDVTDKKGSVTFKDHICYYRLEDSVWKHKFTARMNCLIDLDIDKKQFTDRYFLKKEGQYTRYVPDFGYAFKSVTAGGRCLWKTEDLDSSSPSVTVNELASGDRSVTVNIINGANHVFMVNAN